MGKFQQIIQFPEHCLIADIFMCGKRVFIYWDESRLWGLMILRALEAFGTNFWLVNSGDIQRNILLRGKCDLLLVPGGSARMKSDGLGTSGLRNIREWLGNGGDYMGICGGAGLALSCSSGNSLGICPWSRASFSKRSSHFFSGHVNAVLSDQSVIKLPIWWPGRFEIDKMEGIKVIARYKSPCPDLFLGDRIYSQQSMQVAGGECEGNEFPAGQPLAIMGKYGKGRYILSYAHPETPQSEEANIWLADILTKIFNLDVSNSKTWNWNIANAVLNPVGGDFTCAMRQGFQEIFKIMKTGVESRALFPRYAWLYGWRNGFPGITFNCLLASFAFLAAIEAKSELKNLWSLEKEKFNQLLISFIKGAKEFCGIYKESDSRKDGEMAKLKMEVFGHAVSGGGIAGILLDMLDNFVYLQYRQN